MKNYFRLVRQYDEFIEYQCLKCKKHFQITTMFLFCPLCGIKFDDQFIKHNPRYRPKNDYSWLKPGYKIDERGLFVQSDKPRLIIENGVMQRRKLSLDSFSTIPCQPQLIWSLCCQTEVGWCSAEVSAFVFMWRTFKNMIKLNNYSRLRLRLLNGTDSRIIKEWVRNE